MSDPRPKPVECTRCGACCVAPDIAALDKPLGLRCPHLQEDNLCGVYEQRPAICRDYQPDEVCTLIEAPTLEERVEKYLGLFGLQAEARALREQGCASMRVARRLATPPRTGRDEPPEPPQR